MVIQTPIAPIALALSRREKGIFVQYIKINQVIAEQIDQGMLAPGQKLPSERQLAESFATTRVTLREALSLLEADGLIYREDRRGWFISYPRLRFDLNSSLDFVALACAQQRQPSSRVLNKQTVMANKAATQLLELAPFSEVQQLDQLFCLEQRPVCYSTFWISRKHFGDFLQHNFDNGVLQCCQQHYGVEWNKITHQITTCALLGERCQQLHSTPGTPALVITRRFYNNQHQVIAAEVAHWRHNALELSGLSTF
jgi:DNA-binding GntR family transcriptional regulator